MSPLPDVTCNNGGILGPERDCKDKTGTKLIEKTEYPKCPSTDENDYQLESFAKNQTAGDSLCNCEKHIRHYDTGHEGQGQGLVQMTNYMYCHTNVPAKVANSTYIIAMAQTGNSTPDDAADTGHQAKCRK